MELRLSHVECPNTRPDTERAFVGEFKTVVHEGAKDWTGIELECVTCGTRVSLDIESLKDEMI